MEARILTVLCVLKLLLCVNSQIPSFGRCPEYDAMPDFDKEKFLGTWYEVERYFTVTEVVSRCIKAEYERRADGNIYVKNYYTNRINRVEQIISGKLSLTGKGGEGRFNVRYDSFPLSYNASLVILDTDYKNYAVVWSCSNITPIGHTESAWLMARQPTPRGEILQAAYGVLDKYKLNRTFFVRSDQTDCEILPPILEAIDPTKASAIKKSENVETNTVVNDDNNNNNANNTISINEKSEVAATVEEVKKESEI